MSKLISIRPTSDDESLVIELRKIAKKQNRSLNNLVLTILKEYVRKAKTKKP